MTIETDPDGRLAEESPDGDRDTASSAGKGPLAGYRVLDLTSVIMGPYATQILADMGAEVITIERASGDTNRVMDGGPHPELSGIALNLHRTKRNISLDIRQSSDREILLDLVETADVVVTNLRPGVLRRARITYDDIRARQPNIVFCQAHGFASDTPEADLPAYDDIIQAASGLVDASFRATGTPAFMPTIVADKVCALTIAYSVAAALAHRERTGIGEHIEIPMLETARAFTLVEHGAAAIHSPGQGRAGYERLLSPERRPQQCSDGWICVLPYSKEHYDDIFSAYAPNLVGDDRYQTMRDRIVHSAFLYQEVRAVLLNRTIAEWVEFCIERGIPCSPVVSLDELVDELPVDHHPIVGDFKAIPFPVRFAHAGTADRTPAPLIGQDTEAILREIGRTPK